MLRRMKSLVALIVMGFGMAAPVSAVSIPIENASFETPVVDPNGFGALPVAEGWTELDVDTLGGTNTGVFVNTAADSPDHVANADGDQLAFLGSELGNGFQQELAATYEVGCDYRLSVGVGVSMRFPPSMVEPVDTIELVLYYLDEADSVVDIASAIIEATGLSATQLEDFSLSLPAVGSEDAWAGKTIGIAIRATGMAGGFWDLDNVRLVESVPVSIYVENASFEYPVIDPNAFSAVPYADGWTEPDVDTLSGSNTGVFANTSEDSWDHTNNADGVQIAFLGSQKGNAFEQDLTATYKTGCDYRLTVAVGVSSRYQPSIEEPLDTMELVLYYYDETESVDIVARVVDATNLSIGWLQDFSVEIPNVQPSDLWAGKSIGIAIRSEGQPGGFWILDDVRLIESMPTSIPVENASFESPVIDPNAFSAVPYADGWIELDVDNLSSSNTGVFANTAEDSWDHTVNADGFQIAFLGSQKGNGFEQDLPVAYEVGCQYRLTVAVDVSSRYQPSIEEPLDRLELVLYYYDETESVDIAVQSVDATYLTLGRLRDFSVYVPSVQSDDLWAGKSIGIAMRSEGQPGGFWILDHVRLAGSLPVLDSADTN
ncbi:MAG: hypothetical protein JXM79_09290 [Sedimentisphaerales bacterium]|nr:hypothetical protein [Sedimentisphaerales bacterium]